MFAAPGPFWAAYDTVLKSPTHEDGYGYGFIGFHALSQILFAIRKLIPGATPWYFSSDCYTMFSGAIQKGRPRSGGGGLSAQWG